jgi:hypothetical protein
MNTRLRKNHHLRFIETGADDADGAGGDAQDTDQDGADGDEGGDDGDEGEDGADSGADALGDAGKQALDRMKAKLKDERTKRQAAERALADKEPGDETAQAVRAAETTALAKANTRIVRSEVKAAASGKLADPADAYKFLDLDQFEVDEDGNVDEAEIAEAIDELVKNKPYLAAQGGRRFTGSGDGGARKDARPKQLTRADLARMTPQQIADAQAKGQLADLLKTPKN